MIINFVFKDVLKSIILPEKISGQFWFSSPDDKKVVRVEGVNEQWILKTVSDYRILSKENTEGNNENRSCPISSRGLYRIVKNDDSEDRAYIFTEEYTVNRTEFYLFRIPEKYTFTIGNGKSPKTITFENEYVSTNHATLDYSDGKWKLIDDGSKNGTFVNGHRETSATLKYGDVVFIVGMKIIVGNGWMSINNPDGKVNFYSDQMSLMKIPKVNCAEDNEDDDSQPEEDDYFDRSPRFKRSVEEALIHVDSPPNENSQDEAPVILTIGPAMTMAMASMTSGAFAVTNAISNNNIKSAVPTLAMSLSMCLGTLLWPNISRKYAKKQKKIKEDIRRVKYSEYLDRKRIEIGKICEEQSGILSENNITTEECEKRIINVSRNLWERSIGHDDFLTFRAGTGDLPMYGKLQYNERKFSLNDDILEDKMFEMCEEPKILKNVPVAVSLLEQSVGIIGQKKDRFDFIRGMIIQLAALYSYDEVKLAVLYDSEDTSEFEFVKWLPHVWTNEKNLRMVAEKAEEVKSVAAHIERVFSFREQMNENELENESPFYIIIALDKKQFDRAEVFKRILASQKKVHVSIVAVFSELRMLPKECSTVIELDDHNGRIYNKNDTSGEVISFHSDISLTAKAADLSVKLSNIHLDENDQSSKLPKMITFLQMMGVGKVEHLNSLIRWRDNDPTKSLAVPVGVNPYGDLFMLDLHEKFHGPHGLVAGMTGSGKSEFVITYILSLAVNFHPDEVSFIMIDYKGGGMAKSFENLPHTAGIITNLDGSAIKRSLVSINSELKRRQAILTAASKIVGESNLNIYQYQKLYREHVVTEPLSHLFIIADEFAELKTQQPDFMTELISAARIGRSLGVHLILATQKPSGVVDDQIWSNSRFRVCLKVQEKQDSMDMLKRPDAAELADTGRFYLQVGYNELFEMGQSSWAGAEYYPSDHVIVEKDDSVEAIDLNGQVIRAVKPKQARHSTEKPGKQLDRITDYLRNIASEESIRARQLWLEPIPEIIIISELEEKYPEEYSKSLAAFEINPVIGEYDDPANQRQGLLTVPISNEGNLIIYGTAGSGKSTLLNSMLWSVISDHTPDEVNLYILDFADETLGAFSGAPHVGEVMLSHDGEKIARLFKSLYVELRKRKKKLSLLGMDYLTYAKKDPENADMPSILIVISNFAAFTELYPDNEDDIIYLSREGTKYGVYFILSSLTTNGVRYRISQNFKQHLVLQQNDDGDYSTILGKTDGLFPAKLKGRGLVKTDKIYEFQSAHISRDVPAFDAVKKKCAELALSWNGKTAERIPVLPDIVDADFLASSIDSNNPFDLPVGVNKNTLKIQNYDFSTHCINMLLSADPGYTGFLGEFINLALKVSGLNLVVFDAGSQLGADASLKNHDGVKWFAGISECNDGLVWLFDEIVKRNNSYKDALAENRDVPEFEYTICVIVSMKKLSDALTEDKPERLKLVLEKNDTPFRFSVFIGDEARDVSGYSFAPWYKKQVSGADGIWYGNGISEQYVLKPNTQTPAMRQPISAPLGYVLAKGEAALCKLLSEGSES